MSAPSELDANLLPCALPPPIKKHLPHWAEECIYSLAVVSICQISVRKRTDCCDIVISHIHSIFQKRWVGLLFST